MAVLTHSHCKELDFVPKDHGQDPRGTTGEIRDREALLSRSSEFFRRCVRWVLPGAVIAFTPKCLLCVLAYIGLGTTLGFRGPEICGATVGLPWLWTPSLATLWVTLGIGGLLAGIKRRRKSFRSAGARAEVCDPGKPNAR
jgi:hypothetical protein